MRRFHPHGHHHHHGHEGGGAPGGGGSDYLPDISLEALMRFGVLPSVTEIYRDSLYDSAPYPAAGVSTLPFFAQQTGQGSGFLGTGKTLSETNMELSGQLSAGTGFLVEDIEIEFQPATPFAAENPLVNAPAAFGAQNALNLINDVYVLGRAGVLQFNGPNQKVFLINGPLNRFPATRNLRLEGSVADATTLAAAKQSRFGFARWEGEPFSLHPVPIYLDSNMKFSITLSWPEGLQALPSGVPARIFVRLVGLRVHLAAGAQCGSERDRWNNHRAHLLHHHHQHHQRRIG